MSSKDETSQQPKRMPSYAAGMAMKRMTVYADSDDLAEVKRAATALSVSQAEIIREAIHLAALRHRRRRYRPLGLRRFHSGDPTLADRASTIIRESMGGHGVAGSHRQ